MIDLDTLSKLPLEEKILLTTGQDLWRTYSFEHAGIPYAKLTDGPNGARGGGNFCDSTPAALFPSPSCLAATFDVEAAHHMGKGIAEDSRSKQCHVSLAPTVNMTRDQRYGRAFENYGEDPILSGIIGAHWTIGCQSVGVAATPKHFVTNEAEADRRYSNSIVDEASLREIYLEPFRRIFKELARAHRDGKDGEKARVFQGKPGCIMTAYNQLNGVSSSQNNYLLIDVLRKEWGFDGLVMSDWFALHSDGFKGGCDLEMPGRTYWRQPAKIKAAIEAGEIDVVDIDRAATQTLKLINRVAPLGFVSKPSDEKEESIVDEDREKIIRRIAAEGAVLLKNEGGVLPLRIEGVKKVALIGRPWKEPIQSGGGSADLIPQKTVSAFDALRAALNELPEGRGRSVDLVWHEGCDVHSFPHPILGQHLLPNGVNVEYFAGDRPPKYGESDPKPLASRHLDEAYLTPLIPFDNQCELNNHCLRAVFDFVAPSAGKHTIGLTCLGNARLLALRQDSSIALDVSLSGETDFFEYFLNENKLAQSQPIMMSAGEKVRFILEYIPAHQEGMAALLSSCAAFRLGFDEERDHNGVIAQAARLAAGADLAIVLTGVGKNWESEGFDRPDLLLPKLQNALVEAVARSQPRTLVVNAAGSAVEMPWLDQVKAVVQTWYGGQEAAEAIVDVLLGRGEAPASGRLCTTWPRSVADQPGGASPRLFPGEPNKDRDGHPDVYYDESRLIGYRWYEAKKIEPLFWFGEGLGGYTTFNRQIVTVKGSINSKGGRVLVEVEVHNTGKLSGKDVVQLYVSKVKGGSGDDGDGAALPLKKLVAFETVRLAAGEKRTVKLRPLEADDFSRPVIGGQTNGDWKVIAGRYDAILANSANPKNEVERREIVVEDSWIWRGLEPLF